MFLVASVECLIPVCLCIGEVVPAQGHRYLATSPEAAVSRPNTQSEFPESCLSVYHTSIILPLLYHTFITGTVHVLLLFWIRVCTEVS